MVTYYVSLNESYFFDSLLLPDEMDEDVADEPNSKGELNVTRMSVVLEEKVSSTHLVLINSSGKKGTSSRITSWNINRKEWTQLVVVDVGNT
jgi:hypothetical protein